MMQKADILSVTLEEGELRVALGDSATNVAEIPDATFWALDGFFSRPKPPDEDGACQALYERSGNAWRIVGTKDNRLVEKYGELADGDRAIVSYGEARFLLKDASDSVTIMTKNRVNNGGQTMLVQLSGANGLFDVQVGGQQGTSQLRIGSGRIELLVDGGGSIIVHKGGVSINGQWFGCNTGGGNLGTIVGAPPVPGANSLVAGPAGQIAVASPNWTVSPA